MLLKTIAISAATASAFLVVPQISEADDGIFQALPIEYGNPVVPAVAFERSLDVPCRQCKGRHTHLQFDLTIDDKSRLLLNGFELYPVTDPWTGDLTANVVKGNGHEKTERLGYSLAVEPMAVGDNPQLQVVDIELHVIEVGGRFVDDVPAIQIHLVSAENGELLIADANLKGVNETPCNSMLCHVKEMFGKVTKGFKGKACGAHKGKGGHDNHHGDSKHHHGDSKHHHGDSKGNGQAELFDGHDQIGDAPHYREGGEHRGLGHLLVSIGLHVFVPVLMGIVSGVGVAFLAMFVCGLALRVGRLFRCEKKQSARSATHKAAPSELAIDEEKAGLMAEAEEPQDAPPQYTDDSIKN